MQGYYSQDYTVLTSDCDTTGKLAVAHTFALFQDMASVHAQELGVGGKNMAEKHAFWLTVRTRVHIYRRPEMMEHATVETWPAAPGKTRCDRFYRLFQEGEVLAEGRTEWAVLDLKNGGVMDVASAGFPEDLEYLTDAVLPAPYARFKTDVRMDDKVMEARVRPSDTDVGNHMNNVAYIRLLLDSFATTELSADDIEEMEIIYLTSLKEGDLATVCRRKNDRGYDCSILSPLGKPAALARITLRQAENTEE